MRLVNIFTVGEFVQNDEASKQASKQAVQVATGSIVGYYAHKMRSLNYTFPVGSRTLLAALISTHPDCKIARTVSKCPFTAATWRIVRPFWGANIQIRYRSQFTGPPKKNKNLVGCSSNTGR